MIFFGANLMNFFSKKNTKYSLVILIFHICAKFQSKKERLVMACVFECFQSYCHILEELHNFLCMMGAITIFGESIFIFSFVVMDW
jgi:hypothetical protein